MVLRISKEDATIFSYINYQGKLKPLADLKFQYADNKAINFAALVDSGADRSCSFVSIGKKLGVDFTQYDKQESVAYGLSGKGVPGYNAPISFWIGKHLITIECAWMDIKFNPDVHYFFILGRERVFDEFDIVFQEHKKVKNQLFES